MPLIIDDPLLLWAQEQFEIISNWAADTFGAGSSVNAVIDAGTPALLPIAITTGIITDTTITTYGDSSKPISVYAKGVTKPEDFPDAKAGIKVHTSQNIYDLHAGFNNTGLSSTAVLSDTSSMSIEVAVNLKDGQAYLMFYNTVNLGDYQTESNYIKLSLNAWPTLGLLAGYEGYQYLNSGEFSSHSIPPYKQPAY